MHAPVPPGASTSARPDTRALLATAASAVAANSSAGVATAGVPAQSTASALCPSEWDVCDDPSTSTRYFVIQGSDTIDHWKLNLTFDPVVFEDPKLKTRVRVCVGMAKGGMA